MSPPPARLRAFTILELLVVIGIITILVAILLPTLERVRHQGYIVACASNLHQLGEGVSMYANDNHGSLSRTLYVPGRPIVAGTGAFSDNPFGPGGPAPNDVSAALWLLRRVQKLPASIFICPYNDVNEFQPDTARPLNHSNFSNYKRNLGYSYANPYPDAQAAKAGYKATIRLGASFAVMADLNPGISALAKGDPFKPTPASGLSIMRYGNSRNHEREGQNVLYGDGHVTYRLNPFVGINRDNIYTSAKAVSPNLFASPAGPGDSVLLPVD